MSELGSDTPVRPLPAAPPPLAGEDENPDCSCTDAEIAAEQASCDAAFDDGMKRYRVLKQERDTLGREVYLYNLQISAYEGELLRFAVALSVFSNMLGTYLQAIQGRAYTTTALNDFADQLDQARVPLQAEHDQLDATRKTLDTAATSLNQRIGALKSGLQKLIDDLAGFLKRAAFRCIVCRKAEALLALAQVLLKNARFTVRTPSAAPASVPPVPRLPGPPKPGTPGYAPPAHRPGHGQPSFQVILSPPMPAMTSIEAGLIWPYVVPLEGAPRFCIEVPFWWTPANPTGGIRTEPPAGPLNPTGDFFYLHYKFGQSGKPSVNVSGGLTASEISVSQDGRFLFFTLLPNAPAAPGLASVTVLDGGVTIRLQSSDPTTSIRFTDDLAHGFAALQLSAMIAVDSVLCAAPSPPMSFQDFAPAFAPYRDAYQAILKGIAGRYAQGDPDPDLFGDFLEFAAVAGPAGQGTGTWYDPSLGGYPFVDLYDWDNPPSVGEAIDWIIDDMPAASAAQLDDLLTIIAGFVDVVRGVTITPWG